MNISESAPSGLLSQQASHVKTPYERLLTPREVANWLGVSDRWVRDHATRRLPQIPAVTFGSLLRFRRSDVDDFVTAQFERSRFKFLRRK